MAIYIKILQSMAENPEGFQFQTLSTKFPDLAKKGFESKPTSTRENQTKPENQKRKKPKSKEEEEAENDLGSYANLIYETIKNFFSGIIEIKGKFSKLTEQRRQNNFRVRKPRLQNQIQHFHKSV